MGFLTDALGFTGQDPVKVEPYKASDIYSTTGSAVGGPGGSVTTSLSPELQQFYDVYLREATKNLPTGASQDFANQVAQYGQSMFGNAANLNTGAMTNDYYNQVLQGLEPGRLQENVNLGNTLFTQGRTGLGVGYGGGGYVNPEQFSLLKAREQANAGIYLSAQDRARQIQQEQLKGGIGYVGLGSDLKTAGYALPTSLFGTGVQLGQINNPLINPSLAGGQYVTGVNTQNAQYQNQANLADQAFWGGLISSAVGATNPLGKFSNLFGSTPATGGGMGGGGMGGNTGMISSGFGYGSQNPIGYNFNAGW
jgi:hypothetical protein